MWLLAKSESDRGSVDKAAARGSSQQQVRDARAACGETDIKGQVRYCTVCGIEVELCLDGI